MSGSNELVLKSLSRNTLSKQVVERIVQLLANGDLKPGDKLPTEMELMEQLGVSRPVLREALSSLETMEVIVRKTREGTYINNKIGSKPFSVMLSLSSENLPAIIEARMMMELGLVTIAAEKINDAELKKLRQSIEAIENSPDNNYGKFDREFHRIIAFSVDNPVIEGFISSLLFTHGKTDSLIEIREKQLTAEQHWAIYDALAKRDPEESFRQMYRHLSYVRKKILSL
jgi:GntR family transcriptional repressor for pyruvate dehydrogenase complex